MLVLPVPHFLSAQKDEIDRVAGFTAGADDYVVKPFSPRELVERVRAILRRYEAGSREGPSAALCVGGLELDPERYRVSRDGEEIKLTLIEFRLLQALMSAPGRVQTREALIAHWYDDEPDVIDRVIDVHIGKLRRKLVADVDLVALVARELELARPVIEAAIRCASRLPTPARRSRPRICLTSSSVSTVLNVPVPARQEGPGSGWRLFANWSRRTAGRLVRVARMAGRVSGSSCPFPDCLYKPFTLALFALCTRALECTLSFTLLRNERCTMATRLKLLPGMLLALLLLPAPASAEGTIYTEEGVALACSVVTF
ncbi:winged helix-turn-helix domain-containing protein [Alkalilimnicola ehrlichii]|uniref:winged helix-turn-helix domain-containing protein n=1 Tax=Alkalilimnicola ehrlichii TaxID=351052 RepID=UPI000673D586